MNDFAPILRLFFMTMWMGVNITCLFAGYWLWQNPIVPGGREWPFGGGVFFCGCASLLFWLFHLTAIIKS